MIIVQKLPCAYFTEKPSCTESLAHRIGAGGAAVELLGRFARVLSQQQLPLRAPPGVPHERYSPILAVRVRTSAHGRSWPSRLSRSGSRFAVRRVDVTLVRHRYLLLLGYLAVAPRSQRNSGGAGVGAVPSAVRSM